MSAVAIAGLTKRFGSLTAVDTLDLTVAPGEVYGLLGPNGAGKTTTIRSLLGYLNATAGSASVLGGDARDPDIRRRIGYLPGDLRLDHRNRVGELLTWYADLRGGVPSDQIADLCERFKLDRSKKFGELSKGNRQKVGVVQAVMHQPDVLVLDEPTSGLDPLMQREVMRIVAERRDAGAAVLFSSHIIAEVEEVADRVGILREGHKVVEDTVRGLERVIARQQLTIRFSGPVPEGAFDGVAGLVSVSLHDSSADVVVQGSLADLVRRLAELPVEVERLNSDPLVLDDIFYGVYDAGGES